MFLVLWQLFSLLHGWEVAVWFFIVKIIYLNRCQVYKKWMEVRKVHFAYLYVLNKFYFKQIHSNTIISSTLPPHFNSYCWSGCFEEYYRFIFSKYIYMHTPWSCGFVSPEHVALIWKVQFCFIFINWFCFCAVSLKKCLYCPILKWIDWVAARHTSLRHPFRKKSYGAFQSVYANALLTHNRCFCN